MTDLKSDHILSETLRIRLATYVRLLDQWRKITNLISEDGFRSVWDRHILDAYYLYLERPAALTWLDIGSGAGLPSVVIACILKDIPGAKVYCVEIDRRKCAFLRNVASDLGLPMKILNKHAERVVESDAPHIDVFTARALSSLERLLALSAPYLERGAEAIFPRGRSTGEEIGHLDSALYTVDVRPNPSSGDGFFVHIRMPNAIAS